MSAVVQRPPRMCDSQRDMRNFVSVTPMKWLGAGDGDAALRVENMDRGPQRTQDDAAVGYVFQRPPDPEFPPFGPKQARWALGDDSIIDVSSVMFVKSKAHRLAP